jgi:UDPglucose--hexose-1-phosphate uridylyltransferase
MIGSGSFDETRAAAAGYRIDPLTGAPVRIVAHRQVRPNLPGDGCPFCPGGSEAPDDYEVFAFTNRWPPFPDDRAEIVLYTPDHDASFADLDQRQARLVVDLWADRSAALGARDDVDYVLVFENRGPEVGATIPHPHGQIYAFDVVPPAALVELDRGQTDLGPGEEELVVARAEGWRGWIPAAAAWPYELLLAPDGAVPDLPSLDEGGRDGLARLLIDVIGRLDALFDAPMPFMLWFHQRPFDGGEWPAARLHAHIAPLLRAPGLQRFVAAGELGSGVWFNPVEPARAAADLRATR